MLPLSALAAAIGLLSACAGWGLLRLINLATQLAYHGRFAFGDAVPAGSRWGAWALLVPAAGGLGIGLMARFGSEKIRGHGIPEALEAILIGRSRMSLKVALLKPLASALSIGTGGPFGAEGPIIMTGGAAGSLIAQLFHLTSAERKTLLVAGAAGGMSAVFGTPMAAVLLAIELLLFEWRPRSFIPVAVAASVASVARGFLLGPTPIFPVAAHAYLGGTQVGCAFALGLAAGLASMALTALVYACEDGFGKLRLHWMWWPALGGLAVGAGGWLDPRALGVGYGTIHGLLLGNTGGSLARLAAVKAMIWSIALGSGTSGGVLAPLLTLGGCLGVLAAPFLPAGDPALWALVGMAAIMGGTMRSPLTGIVFGIELTHDVAALPALLAGCAAAHGVTVLFLRRSILTEKLARRGLHLSREYAVDPLRLARVAEIMDPRPVAIQAELPLAGLSARLAAGDAGLGRHHAWPILDPRGDLAGILTRGDLVRALGRPGGGSLTALEAGNRAPATAFPDETLEEAMDRMLNLGVGRLLVVRRDNPVQLIGYLGRPSLLSARLRSMDEESRREGAWRMPFGKRAA
jgi:CIC family chloride channel protein